MIRANGRGDAANRVPITVSIMLAAIMTTLDSTIANVALPHIQGSVSASAEQIAWVLTSYIVASAIMTPLTGFLADRFGRKRLFLISIAGFTAASALCGLAVGLVEIVAFRMLQGAFGAALMPLSQATLLDINPPERAGQAMAVWGAGVVIGPLLGPVIGGWLTEELSWRWVFYINLPIGLLAFAGVVIFMTEKKGAEHRPFDFVGFASLALAVASLQLLLDRGPGLDWFYSTETCIYLIVFAMSAWVFGVQVATGRHPFISLAILKDRNLMVATLMGFFIGILMFSPSAVLPSMMQSLLGYPVAYSGLVSVPRGLGSLLSMLVAGQFIGRVNVRVMLAIGMALMATSFWQMSQFNLQMDSWLIQLSGFLQGFGMGFIFIPLNVIAFSTLPSALRAEASGLYTLVRTIGSSVGISLMQASFVRGVATTHAFLVEAVRPDNPLFNAYAPGAFVSQQAIAMLDGSIWRQAMMVSYVNGFTTLLGLCLLAAPLILIMRAPKRSTIDPVHTALE